MNKKYFAICMVIILLLAGSFIFHKTNKTNDIPNTKLTDLLKQKEKDSKSQYIQRTITVDSNVKLLGSKPYYVDNYKENSFTKISILNNGKEETVLENGKRISFATFNDEGIIILPNKQKGFVLYDYTLYKDYQNKTKEKVENSYIYSIDSKGKVKLFYQTHYLFDSVTFENGVLTMYERLPNDPTNMYPSYLKPYYKVKFQYEKGKFREKGKTFVDTISNIQNKKSS